MQISVTGTIATVGTITFNNSFFIAGISSVPTAGQDVTILQDNYRKYNITARN